MTELSDLDLLAKYPAGSRDVRFLVIKEGDLLFQRHLGGLPSPMLLRICSDGKGHDAWCEDGYWRARDDEYDARRKPADVAYTRVIVGLNPWRKED